MSSDVENGYTFRMGDHEITMRDSFASMLDTTQLTDCLLVCHTHLKDGVSDTGPSAAANGLTNGHTSPVPASTRRQSMAKPDVTPSDQILRTHRVILSASSDYFRSVFSSVPNTLNNGVVAVIITNVDFDDLQSIIDFIYKGQVSVGTSRIHKFLAAAQLLMIKGLMNIKLVNNEDQPIDETSFAENELIQRLKTEKRQLEYEVKAVKEKEKLKIDRIRRDIESELKKKLELEKSILSEEKQRFEAEKMKFTIEKEVFEKNKSKAMANKINNLSVNCVTNSNNSSNVKQIVVNNSNKTLLVESLPQNGDQSIKTSQNETNITTRSLRGTPNKPSAQNTQPKPETVNTSAVESPAAEPEGRQLRKRIKLSDNTNETKESTTASENKTNDCEEEEQQMDVEEEDGEVYEVDFSQTQDEASDKPQDTQTTTPPEVSPNEQKETEETQKEIPPAPQTPAIVASTVAYVKTSTPSTTTTPATPSHMPTRSLRRSTSSIGSASTQSISGENGTDGEPGSLKRKGPGRASNWYKEEGVTPNPEPTPEPPIDSTPLTRARQQRVSQELTPNSIAQPYTCPYCPQEYYAHNSMQDHINGVHLNQKTQYICDYCHKVYTWRISLNKHLRTVHPNEPIPE